ncbi:hypothetical protein TeGR_g12981, partial [Tetraparma gracilis]
MSSPPTPPAPPGLCWPMDAKTGRAATTPVNKSVWVSVLQSLGSASALAAAEAIGSEKNWRANYTRHVHAVAVEQAAATPERCLASCARGLAELNSVMMFRTADTSKHKGATITAEQAFKDPATTEAVFTTTTSAGTGAAAAAYSIVPPVGHPSFPNPISGPELAAQADAWAAYGCVEPSAAASLKAVAAAPDPGELARGKVFVLLGATSALGAFRPLADLGATIACVARPGKRIDALVEAAKSTAATLLLPTCGGRRGADMLSDGPALAEWIAGLGGEGRRIVLCSYAYLDGEAHVRASVAMDLIAKVVMEQRPDTALVQLVSPATSHLASRESMEASARRYAGGPMWHALLSPAGQFRPNAAKPNAGGLCVVNGLSNMQGPNYALAKTSQQWRAMVAKGEGKTVSAAHAPAARTAS